MRSRKTAGKPQKRERPQTHGNESEAKDLSVESNYTKNLLMLSREIELEAMVIVSEDLVGIMPDGHFRAAGLRVTGDEPVECECRVKLPSNLQCAHKRAVSIWLKVKVLVRDKAMSFDEAVGEVIELPAEGRRAA